MKRESLKMSESDWTALLAVAQKTGSIYSDKPSWRRLILRIARGEILCREKKFNYDYPRHYIGQRGRSTQWNPQ
jgi:hypothetical protein